MRIQAIEHAGTIAKMIVEGDHGSWTVTIIWGGYDPFRGQGKTLADAYQGAINEIILRANDHNPGIHALGTELTPGRFDR